MEQCRTSTREHSQADDEALVRSRGIKVMLKEAPDLCQVSGRLVIHLLTYCEMGNEWRGRGETRRQARNVRSQQASSVDVLRRAHRESK